MNTFQLRCFLAVAEHLNFARAAEQLYVTQPAVTQQIHSLEKELDVRLFQRTTRSVRLTTEGQVFLNDARQMLLIAERAKKRFENGAGKEFRLLSLGCYDYASLFALTRPLRRLAVLDPDIHPRLQVFPYQHVFHILEEGDLDAVVGFRDSSSTKVSALFREILKVPVVCVCPPDHPLARKETVHLEDLRQERLVLLSLPRVMPHIAKIQGELMGGRSPASFYFCDCVEAAGVLVQAGFGVSILPRLITEDSPGIASVPLQGVDPIPFGVYYRTLQDNPALKLWLQAMREAFLSPDGVEIAT